jgi:NAD-dependent DNA ligase
LTQPKLRKGKRKAETNIKASEKDNPPNVQGKPSAITLSSYVNNKKVLISGTIPGHDRKSSEAVVKKAGADVAKSFNKQVELLILGTNPGPDKLTKAKDLNVETIKWADLCKDLGIEAEPEAEVADVEIGDAPDSIEGTKVLISGTIGGQTRASAQKLLESAGGIIVKSLNDTVELVVLGTNPGPKKLNEIAEQGIETCTWDDLIEELGLEVIDQPPQKKAKKT